MSENKSITPQSSIPAADEINLLDLLIVFAKYKKMILGITLLAALLAVGYAMRLPNIYTATAKILPPQSNQSGSVNAIMLAQLGGLAGAVGGALGKDSNALYIAMLKSRDIGEKLVRRFDLQKVYGTQTLADTLRVLEEVSTIASGKDGIIAVGVDDKDPERASVLANAYIEELNKMMQTLALTEAGQRRQFFETQVKSAKDKLTDAEISLDRTPNTSLHYLDAMRNLKFQEGIYEVLLKQFEVAKLDEAKDSLLIQILDKAFPPEKKSKPKRASIVLLSTFIAFLFAVTLAFVREGISRAKKQPEQAERMRALRNASKWRAE